jgi:hypothetical protein
MWLLRVGKLRIAVAEAWEQFGSADKEELLPLEAVTKRLVKRQQTEETKCVL